MDAEQVSQGELLAVIGALVDALKPFAKPEGWLRYDYSKDFEVSCWYCAGKPVRAREGFEHLPHCPVVAANDLIAQLGLGS